ncbi:tryptophan ABC transporter substrate-binding protein [Streptococcus didelphis]|uniref:tryptophan ABC transporter substrate-binding protein n=1 Tax=Streptococcus didelphis TaxID=102886 RepID=UPI0003754610|nr:tryptophan ABC transporter substrate-binding protein [Streptococcus didelphis]
MKNKGLRMSLLVIIFLVIGSLVMEKRNPQDKLVSQKRIKVGILQFVSHQALDDIERGIEDELVKGRRDKTIDITLFNAQGDQSKLQTMSQQLVASKNNILIGIATPAAQALASATKDIPVMMSAVSDPKGARLVKNLLRPEANISGLSNKVPVTQTLDMIEELTPNVKTIGILYASGEDNSVSQVKDFKSHAEKRGFKIISYSVPSTNEVSSTMTIMSQKVDAIFLPQDNTIASAFSTVLNLSKENKLPLYVSVDTMVKEGGLASIAQSQYQLGVETAKQVKKIIRGEKISQVPVKIIDSGKPIINQKRAEELGITIPERLRSQSDIIKGH